jgi:hypothetical protein
MLVMATSGVAIQCASNVAVTAVLGDDRVGGGGVASARNEISPNCRSAWRPVSRADRFRLGPEAEGGICASFSPAGFCARKGLAALGSRALREPVIRSVCIAAFMVSARRGMPGILTKCVVYKTSANFILEQRTPFLRGQARCLNSVSIAAGLICMTEKNRETMLSNTTSRPWAPGQHISKGGTRIGPSP